MSSSGGFRADAEELGSLAGRLDACTAEMRRANRKLKNATTSDLGNLWIDAACAGFKNSWDHGIGQVSEMTDAIRGGLETTAQAYSDTELAIEAAFARGTRSTGSSGDESGGGQVRTVPAPETSPFG